jgi:hypothetical protein
MSVAGLFPGDEGSGMASGKERNGTTPTDQDDPQEKRTELMTPHSGPAPVDSPVEADRTESTVVDTPLVSSSSLHSMLLERIEPSLGRGERLRLDASRPKVSLGRAEENDVRLYTASASREHAVIAGSEEGDWVLTLSAGKSVLIDGEMTTEPVVLEVGMNIILGQDHLRCVTEGLGPREMAAQTAVDRSVDHGSLGIRGLNGQLGVAWWAIGVVAAMAAIWLLIALLTP